MAVKERGMKPYATKEALALKYVKNQKITETNNAAFNFDLNFD